MDWSLLTYAKDLAMAVMAIFVIRDIVRARLCQKCGKRHQ